MHISILTLFPTMIEGFFAESIVKRAQEKGLVQIDLVNLREFALDSYGTVDDKPYGGGVGMVMRVEPVFTALQKINVVTLEGEKTPDNHTILTSAKGVPYSQPKAREYAQGKNLTIIAGHYEGVDERVLDYVDEEISLGDFVLTGGEIAAAAITDSVVRLIPGALTQSEATEIESFFEVKVSQLRSVIGAHPVITSLVEKGNQTVTLLEFPQYTRPEEFRGKRVPDILLSGHHKNIEDWRIKQAFEETLRKRPDLFSR